MKIKLLLLFFGISLQLKAQTDRFIPYKIKNDVWIYVKPASSKAVIAEEFQQAKPFNYLGHAQVKIDDKWRWIDTTGKYVFTEYDSVAYFRNKDLYLVKKKGKFGIISGISKVELVSVQYENIELMKFGDEKSNLKTSMTSTFDQIDLLGYTTPKGKKKVQLIQIWLNKNTNPRVAISTDVFETIGYHDYDLQNFSSRLFSVTNGEFFGILNTQGKTIVPPKYSQIHVVDALINANTLGYKKYFVVEIDQKQGLYNTDGQMVLKPIYNGVSKLENCMLPIFRIQGNSDLMGLYFGNAAQIVEPKYITLNYLESTQVVTCRDKKWIEMYQSNGSRLLSNLEISELKELVPEIYTYMSVNNLYGLTTNKEMLLSASFDEIKQIGSNKVIAVRKKNKWALYSISKKQLSAFDFSVIGNYSQIGLINAATDKKQYGFINEEGSWIIPAKYNNAMCFNQNYPLLSNVVDDIKVAPVSVNGKYGFIDAKGNPFINFENDSAQPFSGLIAAVKSKNGWQVIGKGKKLMTRYYQRVKIVSGVALINHKDSSGVLDFEGRWIFPMTKKAIYNIVDHSSDNFPFQRIQDELSFTQVAVVNSFGYLLSKIEDFVIEKIDNSSWLLLGKKQNLLINASGEVTDLKVFGEFEWLNDAHKIGVFKQKNANNIKIAYFSTSTKKVLTQMNDIQLEFDEETLKYKVLKNNLMGFVDESFNLLLAPDYKNIVPVKNAMNDHFIVQNYNGNYAIMNNNKSFVIPFENQFIYDKKYSVETKTGAIDKTVFCVKKATTNQYYTMSQLGVNLIFKEIGNTNNQLNVISDNLFEVQDDENNTLFFVDSKGFVYSRTK